LAAAFGCDPDFDAAARERHMSRSAFLALAAEHEMAAH
jgi:hypothetical protein